MDGLSRKEKLALWRAAKQASQEPAGAGGAAAAGGAGARAGGKGKGGKGKGVPGGVLAARPGAGNKRAASQVSNKEGPKRKPFQVRWETLTDSN